MDFPGAQKGKERKSSSSSKGFWGKKEKERRDQSKESRGERSVQGILATPVSFPTNRSGLRKSKQGIGIHCKLEGGPKNGNKLCQLHCTKWISGLKKQLHLFPFPSSPKYSSVSEAVELDKEGAVHNPDSRVRKCSSRGLKTSPSSDSAENQEEYLKSSKGRAAEENGHTDDGEKVVRICLET